MRLVGAGSQVWELKEEAGSGLNLHPMGCGCVGCRPRAGCRNLPGRCWGHALLLGQPLCAAAFPESTRRPCHLTQVHLGPWEGRGSPSGSACCPRPATPRARVHVLPVRSLAPSVLEAP